MNHTKHSETNSTHCQSFATAKRQLKEKERDKAKEKEREKKKKEKALRDKIVKGEQDDVSVFHLRMCSYITATSSSLSCIQTSVQSRDEKKPEQLDVDSYKSER